MRVSGTACPSWAKRACAALIVTGTLVAGSGCTRSGANQTSAGPSQRSSPPASAAAAAGDFGSLKHVCGPGAAHGATARGVTDSTITVGTMSDAGNTVAPGLEVEFFQVGDAFVKWCNAAGGINGRKLALDKHDAKLFESGERTLEACQKDFMLVGNGDAFDAATVKPRLACKLGQFPAIVVSAEAASAGLQVEATPAPVNEYPVGPYLAMAQLYPADKRYFGIGGSNNASLRSVGLRLRDAVAKIGYTTVEYQEQPPLVPNWRPYVESAKLKGVKGFQEINGQDLTPLITAANNVGWKPDWMVAFAQYYDPKTIAAARVTQFPTTYVQIGHWPFEMADRNAAAAQVVRVLHASDPAAATTEFTASAFNAWLLWAKSATECGSTLTTDCVLAKAAANRNWSAGGLFPAHDVNPATAHMVNCFALMRVTRSGFVYDEKATQPNQSIYNCSPNNIVTLTNKY
jgi:ABC-type branched-subunit amino acid transport system substrate-binding protein